MSEKEKILAEIILVGREISKIAKELKAHESLFVTKCDAINNILIKCQELKQRLLDIVGGTVSLRIVYIDVLIEVIRQAYLIEKEIITEESKMERNLGTITNYLSVMARLPTIGKLSTKEKKKIGKELEKCSKSFSQLQKRGVSIETIEQSERETKSILKALRAELKLALRIKKKFKLLEETRSVKEGKAVIDGIIATLYALGPFLQTERKFYALEEKFEI